MRHKLLVMEWLYKADQDFLYAEGTLHIETLPYYDDVCFLFHQSVEKYLKAYIVKFALRFRKEHDLRALLRICSDHDQQLGSLEDSCLFLNPFYFEMRYADERFVVATKQQAEEAREHARNIQERIRKKLGIVQAVVLEDIQRENALVDEELKKEPS